MVRELSTDYFKSGDFLDFFKNVGSSYSVLKWVIEVPYEI